MSGELEIVIVGAANVNIVAVKFEKNVYLRSKLVNEKSHQAILVLQTWKMV